MLRNCVIGVLGGRLCRACFKYASSKDLPLPAEEQCLNCNQRVEEIMAIFKQYQDASFLSFVYMLKLFVSVLEF